MPRLRFLGDQPHEVAALAGRVVQPGEVVDCPDRYPGQQTEIVWPGSLWGPVDSPTAASAVEV